MRTRLLPTLLLAAATVAGMSHAIVRAADGNDGWRQDTEAWHAGRIARLRQPDGWLSLVGLHWLQPGTHAIGSAAANDVVLAVGPARLGTVSLVDGTVTLSPAADAGVQVDGAPVSTPLVLAADSSGKPTVVRFAEGRASFMLIERSGRLGLRVRDAQAATLTGFKGIDTFDIDPSWRIEARFEPHPPGRTIDIASVINTLEPMPNPGAVVFERDGRTHRLEAVDEGDGQLFLIFADRTNGKETYGAGRFLYAQPPAAGEDTVVLDFNRAYNPPCALNAYSTCPLPPPENRLDLAVTAGEKAYAGATH